MLNTRHANLLLSRPASLQKETKFCGFGREREMLLLKSLLARSGRPPVLTKIPRSRPHIRGSPLHWRAERLTETCGWLCANGKWLWSLMTLAYHSMRRRGHFATTDSTPAFGHPAYTAVLSIQPTSSSKRAGGFRESRRPTLRSGLSGLEFKTKTRR